MTGDSSAVVLAALALIGTILAVVVTPLFGMLKQQDSTHKKLSDSIDRNTKSNQEVLTFMKNLNGKLAKATIQTVQEQTVEHQTIQKVDKE